MNNPWVRRLKIWAGVFVAFMAVLAVVRVWPSSGSAGSPATTTTGTDSSVPVTETATPTSEVTVDTLPPVQVLDSETRAALKIEFSNVSCQDVVESAGGEVIHLADGTVTYQMKDESLVPVGEGGRLRSDMMALPMVNQEDPKASLDEVILTTCQGTLYGATLAHQFTILPFGDEMLIDLEDNPWIKPYAGNTDQINDLALESVYTIDGKSGYYVKPEYQLVAENLAELLIRATLLGFAPEQSTANYHLLKGGMVIDMFSEVGLNPTQEDLLALVLTIDQKISGECLAKIGFNVLDKRPEIFSCYPSTTTTTTPPCTNCGTTPPSTIVCGNKNHLDENGQCVPNLVTGSTTPQPATTQPSGPTTTLACVYGTHRDSATGLCVTNSPPVTVAPPGTIPSTSTPPGPGTTVLGP